MTILVTGGAGYIGSHFVRHLERRKIDFVIVDNFSTGHKKLVENKKFFELDLRDFEEIRLNLQDLDITSIVHFAGLSIVSDSQKNKGSRRRTRHPPAQSNTGTICACVARVIAAKSDRNESVVSVEDSTTQPALSELVIDHQSHSHGLENVHLCLCPTCY